MRLSDILSKPRISEFIEIDGFMSKKLSIGKQRKVNVGRGRVILNFYCTNCNDERDFKSDTDIYCIGVTPRQISIDCVLRCVGECDASVAIWFLVECQDGEDTDKDKKYINNYIYGIAPKVRILKHREKLSEQVRLIERRFGDYTEMLDKSQQAFRDGLGSGSVVYLRKIFEMLTVQAAKATSIDTKTPKGRRKKFEELLKEVDEKMSIIPRAFSEDGYRLFGELSNVLHGNYDEQLGLQKYEAFYRLIVGIIENIKDNEEMKSAIDLLGWNNDRGGGHD